MPLCVTHFFASESSVKCGDNSLCRRSITPNTTS